MLNKLKFSLYTFGCRLNQSETALIEKLMLQKGFEKAVSQDQSDIFIINTCTVTSQSDSKNRQLIRSLHRKNPNACIVVTGCYSQMAHEIIKQIDGVKLIVGNDKKLELVEYLEKALESETPLIVNSKISKNKFYQPVIAGELEHTRGHLKIQDGCDFMCSFCVIPFSRGRSRYRDYDNILDEAKQMEKDNIKEIVLTGVNIGNYQIDNNNLINLLDFLNTLKGIKRIRISSIEPTTVPDGILERMNDKSHKLLPFLHLPLQSGSDNILTLMRRRYRMKDYIREIEKSVSAVEDLCLGTDIMVGFPGESNLNFKETKNLLESLPFAYFHVFPFSERKGTPAFKMTDKIHSREKQRRCKLLRCLSEKKRQIYHNRFINTVRSVLFESTNSKGEITGYSDNYIRVCLSNNFQKDLKNQIHPVKLISSQNERMLGEIVG